MGLGAGLSGHHADASCSASRPPCARGTQRAECLHDLLEHAARLLRLGGRLAYFLPAAPGFYKEEEVPQHPALEVHGLRFLGAGREG